MLLKRSFLGPQINRLLCRSSACGHLFLSTNAATPPPSSSFHRRHLTSSQYHLSPRKSPTKLLNEYLDHDPSYNVEAAAMDAVFNNDLNDASPNPNNPNNPNLNPNPATTTTTTTATTAKPKIDWSAFKEMSRIQKRYRLQRDGKRNYKATKIINKKQRRAILTTFRKLVYSGKEQEAIDYMDEKLKNAAPRSLKEIKKFKYDCYTWLYGRMGGRQKTTLEKETHIDKMRTTQLEKLLTHFHVDHRREGVAMFDSLVECNKANIYHWNLRIDCCTSRQEAFEMYHLMIQTNENRYRQLLVDEESSGGSGGGGGNSGGGGGGGGGIPLFEQRSVVVKPNNGTFNTLIQFATSAEERYDILEQLMMKKHGFTPTLSTLEEWIKQLMIEGYYPQASESVHTVVPEKFGLEPSPEMLAWLECPEEQLELLRRSFLRRMFALATDSKTTTADKDEYSTNTHPSDNQHNSLIVIDSITRALELIQNLEYNDLFDSLLNNDNGLEDVMERCLNICGDDINTIKFQKLVQKYTRHHSPQSQGDVVVTAPGSGGLLDPTLGNKIYKIKHRSKQQRIERKKGRLYMNRERRATQIVRIKTTESEQDGVGHCDTGTDDSAEEVDGHRKTSEAYDDTQR